MAFGGSTIWTTQRQRGLRCTLGLIFIFKDCLRIRTAGNYLYFGILDYYEHLMELRPDLMA